MYDDTLYPVFYPPICRCEKIDEKRSATLPERAVDKEMYAQILKSFETNDDEGCSSGYTPLI